MNPLKSALLLTVLLIGTTAARAMALTIDVCVNPATDARFDTTKTFFTASAPIFPGGSIAVSATPVDCTMVSNAPIGTFFTNGGIVAGLPASDPKDVALVTWHFRIGTRAFDTVGPVQGNPSGGATPGQQYPQTVVGSTHDLTPSNNEATITALDPTGFVFEVSVPSEDHEFQR
jgi:hypothetical protein